MGQEGQTGWNMNNITGGKKIQLSRAESMMRTGVRVRGVVCRLWDRLDKINMPHLGCMRHKDRLQETGQERSSFCQVSQHCLPPEPDV